MKILNLTRSQLAGAPLHLSDLINKYTEHESRVILRSFFKAKSVKDLRWDYPLVRLSNREIEKHISWADVILHHQYPWPVGMSKPHAIMYHAQPGLYRPGKTHPGFNGKKMVIAQYHPRFYTDAEIVPNLIDIWAPEYLPKAKRKDKVVIFMGVASETRRGWGFKNSQGVRKVFNELKQKKGNRVEIRFMKGRPMAEVFEAKRDADIVIDECETGSYHLSSLEGLSYGAVVMNNIDDKCFAAIREVCGAEDHPFVKTSTANLLTHLEEYVEHPELLREKQKASREWIEKYWDPQKRIGQFIRFFEKLNP